MLADARRFGLALALTPLASGCYLGLDCDCPPPTVIQVQDGRWTSAEGAASEGPLQDVTAPFPHGTGPIEATFNRATGTVTVRRVVEGSVIVERWRVAGRFAR